MKNPLNKRIPNELKQEFGKYFVIFAFLVLLISLVSSFLVVTNSMIVAYNNSFEKYNIEDGHFKFDKEPEAELLDDIKVKSNIDIYELLYKNAVTDNDRSVRLYKIRTEVNLPCLLEGKLPDKENEVAIDRLFAVKNNYSIGDRVHISDKDVIISGLIALPDYSCLFEKNTDMMFNATNFTIALVTEDGFNYFDREQVQYNYAWKYETSPDREDDKLNKEMSDEFLEILKESVKSYDEALVQETIASGDVDRINSVEDSIIKINDYVPQYKNNAINFTGEDMGSDKGMFTVFDYLVTLVIAFVFAVTISNTITSEAGVIGTLRASGYTRGEIIRHYLILPILVSFVAAVIGNIIGYTVMKQVMVDMYYNSYSLTTYETIWNAQAFVLTTVIPLIIMFIVNLAVLNKKLRLSPIRFLRHDLSKKGKKKAFRLKTTIPILHRFRIRVIFQNIPNYLTLFFGIFLGGTVIVFGMMFGPLFETFKANILEQRICDYQYILMSDEVETANTTAEMFCLTGLKTTIKDFMEDEVSVYGIEENSKYIKDSIPGGKVLISSAYKEKYGLKIDDVITVNDSYADESYDFVIGGFYQYDGALCVFMPRTEFNKTFDKDEDYFTGFFSNKELTDIEDENIANIISVKELTALSDQMIDSMGNIMNLMKGFGIAMFLLLMYLLSKQIIEKNSQSISMTKILGFYNSEISSIYIIATSIVVVLSLLITCPLIDVTLRAVFKGYLYKVISGYIPFIAPATGYLKVVVLGVACFAGIAALQMLKISKISKADALKNVE